MLVNEPRLPGANSAEILPKGTSLSSLITIREKSHPGEWQWAWQVKIINQFLKHSFNETRLPWMNSAEILTYGTSLPILAKIGEQLNPRDW